MAKQPNSVSILQYQLPWIIEHSIKSRLMAALVARNWSHAIRVEEDFRLVLAWFNGMGDYFQPSTDTQGLALNYLRCYCGSQHLFYGLFNNYLLKYNKKIKIYQPLLKIH